MAAGAQLGAVDLPDQATPAMPGIQGTAPPGAAASPSQPASPGAGATPPLAQPQPGRTIDQGTGKGEIATPTVKPEYDAKKLARAQTTLELLDAMKPKSRTDYMDWWQKQHGDIDDKYDTLKSQLGARAADDEPQTKKEKFAALLEFGLHLMKASAPATTNQGAVLSSTLSDEHDAQQKAHADRIAAAQGQYDTQASAIESARAEEQKGIGTPAAAMKEQGTANRQDAQNLKDTASAYKDVAGTLADKANAAGPATYAVGPGGVIHAIVRDADGHAHAEAVTGIDGKPFAGKVLGREAGSGIDKSRQDTAAMRNHKYLTDVIGLDADTAAKIAFRPKTGSADADHAAVFRSAMAATMGDDEKAKRIADQYVLDNYGASTLTQRRTPLVATPGAPPAAALEGLQKGQVRHFGARGDWTLDIDGKPVRVGAPPQSIQ